MKPTELSSKFGTIGFCNRYEMDFGTCMLLSLSTILYISFIQNQCLLEDDNDEKGKPRKIQLLAC